MKRIIVLVCWMCVSTSYGCANPIEADPLGTAAEPLIKNILLTPTGEPFINYAWFLYNDTSYGHALRGGHADGVYTGTFAAEIAGLCFTPIPAADYSKITSVLSVTVIADGQTDSTSGARAMSFYPQINRGDNGTWDLLPEFDTTFDATERVRTSPAMSHHRDGTPITKQDFQTCPQGAGFLLTTDAPSNGHWTTIYWTELSLQVTE